MTPVSSDIIHWHLPVVAVWTVVALHLFLNINPNNLMIETGRKVWCDRGMGLAQKWYTSFFVLHFKKQFHWMQGAN